jgi:hypothetical protein
VFNDLPAFDLRELNGRTLKISINECIDDGTILMIGTDVETNIHYVISDKKTI